jgi:tyrosine-protein kinase Etk/Wzc
MSAFLTPNNPVYQRAQEELNSLRAESAKVENGRGTGALSEGANGSKSGLENVKVLRDVKYYQMLYELLAKQYEAARLDEAKDPPIIQVLDRAAEPERRAKPKRTVIVLLSTAIAFFFAIGLAFVSETKLRLLEEPASASKWRRLRGHIGFKN